MHEAEKQLMEEGELVFQIVSTRLRRIAKSLSCSSNSSACLLGRGCTSMDRSVDLQLKEPLCKKKSN